MNVVFVYEFFMCELDIWENLGFLRNAFIFAIGELYGQIDGIAKGSPLSPTLAYIIMMALEDAVMKYLPNNDIIKFYVRYVDDTLVLAKPSDIDLILNKLNSYHPDNQFTHEEFMDKNDVHFLDIKHYF